jgi:DNA recombination protein RmuC
MRTLAEYIGDIGKGLDKANQAYNKAVGSMEARVLSTARKFKDLGAATSDEIPPLSPVETTPRALTAPELKEDSQT